MKEFKLIDVDSHIIEPPTLWQDRLPAKFKERAPRQVRLEKGDAWVMEGAADPLSFGHNAIGATPGGMKPEQRTEWIHWEDVQKSCYDPTERLRVMDEDGVGSAMMFPTPRISGALAWNKKDEEFHLACIRAYNDWLSGFCGVATDRLGGVASLPTLGLQSTLGEFRRVMKLPGIRTIGLSQWPNGSLEITPEDDAFFAEVQEAGIPLNIHVGLSASPPAAKAQVRGAVGDMRHLDAPLRAKQLINTGVFDRFPSLNVAFIEVDCGWVPYVKEQFNDRFKRLEPASRPDIKMRPSDYYERNLYFGYITDSFGVSNRHAIGLGQMMWSSDFPHSGTDWPHSWETIESNFQGVPEDEKFKILAGNAARIYKFPNGA